MFWNMTSQKGPVRLQPLYSPTKMKKMEEYEKLHEAKSLCHREHRDETHFYHVAQVEKPLRVSRGFQALGPPGA